MDTRNRMIKCKNCGADLEEITPYCPYCGHIVEQAARTHFLDRLRAYSGKMENVGHDMSNVYRKEVKRGVTKAVRMVFVFVFLLFLLFLGTFMLEEVFRSDPDEVKETISWQREYFPVFDELYEAKEYDQIVKLASECVMDPGYSFYEWEHSEFLICYEYYMDCMEGKAVLVKEDAKEHEITHYLYGALKIVFHDITSYQEMTEEEKEQLLLWKGDAEQFLEQHLRVSKEDRAAMEAEIEKEGYLSYDYCEKKAKELMKKRR